MFPRTTLHIIMVGDVLSNRKFYSQMAEDTGAVVFAPDYRLSPEHQYPAAIDDCVESIKYVFDHAEELKINKSKIVVTGDSAGGHLTLATALVLVETEYQLKGICITRIFGFPNKILYFQP